MMNSYYTTRKGEEIENFPNITDFFSQKEKLRVLMNPNAFVPNRMKKIVTEVESDFYIPEVYPEDGYFDAAYFDIKLTLKNVDGEDVDYRFQTNPYLFDRYTRNVPEDKYYVGVGKDIERLIREFYSAAKTYYELYPDKTAD